MQLKRVVIGSAWKSVYRPQIIAHYFKLLEERIQRNTHRLKNNNHVIELFTLGPLQIRIPDYAHEQIPAMTKH